MKILINEHFFMMQMKQKQKENKKTETNKWILPWSPLLIQRKVTSVFSTSLAAGVAMVTVNNKDDDSCCLKMLIRHRN